MTAKGLYDKKFGTRPLVLDSEQQLVEAMRIFWLFFRTMRNVAVLFYAFIIFRPLHWARWYWSSGEPSIMESQDDRDFAAVIAAIADRRKVDRSGSIVVTPMFWPVLDRLSPTELRNYLFTRYPNRNRRSKD
jgi:hypothetical protein